MPFQSQVQIASIHLALNLSVVVAEVTSVEAEPVAHGVIVVLVAPIALAVQTVHHHQTNMKTQAVHLDITELGLLSNLLYTAMKATGLEFKAQPMPVKTLSTKLARGYQVLEDAENRKLKKVTDLGAFRMTTISKGVKDAL
jgi:hypothetical protein